MRNSFQAEVIKYFVEVSFANRCGSELEALKLQGYNHLHAGRRHSTSVGEGARVGRRLSNDFDRLALSDPRPHNLWNMLKIWMGLRDDFRHCPHEVLDCSGAGNALEPMF